LINGPSTRRRWVTTPDFRPCSAGPPRSQAPLCPCTLCGWCPFTLREPLGASVTLWEATAPVKLPAWPCRTAGILYGSPLDALPRKSGISPLPPGRPQPPVHRLPPILRRPGPTSRPGCSKAPRGLFVLSQVTRIFTGTSISPSPPSRQCSSRYAFRAGRNLPDKEFRYLRTVIVTAAVHRGFGSWLQPPLPLTFRHWAGVSPYTAACAVAETCVFGKQSLEPAPCDPLTLDFASARLFAQPGGVHLTLAGCPFSRSYGANLPSSLTEDRSSTSGVCPLPTSVGVRYGLRTFLALRGFSGRSRTTTSGPSSGPRDGPPLSLAGWCRTCLAPNGPPADRPCPFGRLASSSASPLRSRPQVQDSPPARHRLRWTLKRTSLGLDPD
jgi:hypothetical protein